MTAMPADNASVGNLLHDLRQQRGLSRQQLVERAQVGMRTLRYWEANERSPCTAELEAVLTALEATATERAQVLATLTTPRGLRLAQQDLQIQPNPLPAALPDLGDLMRAMRLRRGWTQERLAQALSLNRRAVYRWEISETYPTEENLLQLGTLLNAHPDELAALSSRRLAPPQWPLALSLEVCERQNVQLHNLTPLGWSPLIDLWMLALKRQLRLLAPTTPEALPLLIHVKLEYATWLNFQERDAEAQSMLHQARAIASTTPTPSVFEPALLNLESGLLHKGPGGAQSAVAALHTGVGGLPEAQGYTVYCDLAYYHAILQEADEVKHWLGLARQALARMQDEQAEENPYYSFSYARSLIELGRPMEAMEWLPKLSLDHDGYSRLFLYQCWSKALLAAKEKDAAMRYLDRMDALLTQRELPLRRRHWEALTQKL
jgi:transcriptional regulator with XRE-family HTH domain